MVVGHAEVVRVEGSGIDAKIFVLEVLFIVDHQDGSDVGKRNIVLF